MAKFMGYKIARKGTSKTTTPRAYRGKWRRICENLPENGLIVDPRDYYNFRNAGQRYLQGRYHLRYIWTGKDAGNYLFTKDD